MFLILIVASDRAAVDLLGAPLAASGYGTAGAVGPAEGLSLVRREKPDLIVIELTEREEELAAFFAALAQSPDMAAVPVIGVGDPINSQRVVRAAKWGLKSFVLKSPDLLTHLLSRVNDTLRPQRRPAAGAPRGSAQKVPRLLTREQAFKRVESASRGRLLPGALREVVKLTTAPRLRFADLASGITHDPALAARVLSAANTIAAESGAEICSVVDAVWRLGGARVRAVAAQAPILDCNSPPDGEAFHPLRWWRHSLAVARLCELLGGSGPGAPAAELAFLVGLFHDLPEMMFRDAFAEESRLLSELQPDPATPPAQVEREMLGATRPELLAALLRHLHLPAAVREPIEVCMLGAFGSARSEEVGRLARLLSLCDACANGMLLASSGEGLVGCFTDLQCRAATGRDTARAPDAGAVRLELDRLLGPLAGAAPDVEVRVAAPMYPRAGVHLWVAKDPALSSFDPLVSALDLVAQVKLFDRLPAEVDGYDSFDALVVCGRSKTSAGFTAADVQRVVEKSPRPLPVLWLTDRREQGAPPASGLHPEAWPVPLRRLQQFVLQAAEGPPAPQGELPAETAKAR